MSLIIVYGARIPVVRIGRTAGQYAKPRSQPMEKVDGEMYHNWRGDNINGMDLNERKPDPQRLLLAYFHSAATLNYIRALLSAGFADLTHPHAWDLGFVQDSSERKKYESIVERMMDALDFMKVTGAMHTNDPALRTCDVFVSHEGLLLDYESALTRKVDTEYYNLGSHFLWIGDRTRQIQNAHVEYFRGIANPIGIKVGPSMAMDELPRLLDILNSKKEHGKVVLITRYGLDSQFILSYLSSVSVLYRYGAKKIHDFLPGHIKSVQESSHKDLVIWISDPMHGTPQVLYQRVKI